MRGRAEAFGILTVEVDGQNVREVYAAAQGLVERARRGEGPAFMLCHTYRYLGHHVGDINRAYYRSPEEEADWKQNHDPLKTLADWLIARRNGGQRRDRADRKACAGRSHGGSRVRAERALSCR